ncbi:MAG: hypothetical protein VX764_09640 [Planctomycetota bacterium]|nr:hypothetical protein [Planctomycetota bacterium]
MNRFITFASLLVYFAVMASVATAQTFQVSSTPQNFVATPGTPIPFSAVYGIEQTSGAPLPMCGFQFQYSHDTSLIEIEPVGFPTTVGEVAALDGGNGPGFIDGQITGAGFTIGMVFSMTFAETITFDSLKPVIRVDYNTVAGAFGGGITNDVVTQIFPSDNLGSPVVDSVMSTCAGSAVPLAGQPFSITFLAPPPLLFDISSPDQSLVASGPNGGSVSFGADFSIVQGGDPADLTPTEGFQFAYRHDAALLEINSVNEGSGLAGLDGGNGPEFFDGTIFSDGFTVGCIYDFMGLEAITFDSPETVISTNYSSVAGAFNGVDTAVQTALTVAGDLGSPAVDPVIVVGGGTAIFATGLPVNLSIQPNPPFTLTCLDQTASFSPDSGAGSFTASLTLEENPDNATFPTDTQGFSLGIAHDVSLLTATSGAFGSTVTGMNSGDGPDFEDINVFAEGVTFGVVYSFQGTEFLQFDTATELVTISYDTVPAALAGETEDVVTILDITDTLGMPPVANVVVIDSQAGAMFGQDGTITLTPGGGFFRADANTDGGFDIGDPITTLGFLFTGGVVTCMIALDANDDGSADIGDAIYMLGHLFTGGPAPPAPFEVCGADPTPGGSLDCVDYPSSSCP